MTSVDESLEMRLKDIKILVVDDDPEVQAAIDHALQAEGALTQCCGDGNTAVRICETDPPDLVVLDMMLPKRSGFLVLEKVKRIASPPRVIMVTANEGKRHQQYAEALGVDGYLLKPVRIERLILLAQDLFAPKEAEPEPEPVAEEAPAKPTRTRKTSSK
jgi:DNA-binding response OmpR family regulator